MSSSASPAFTEAVGDKDHGGPSKNSGQVAIASSMPALVIDLPAVPGVVRPPEADDIIVIDRGSSRG
jgi:hypothetical protein